MASGLFFSCVQNTTPGDCGDSTSLSASASFSIGVIGGTALVGGISSVIANPRIFYCKQKTAYEITGDEHHGRHQLGAHHEVLVLRQQGIQRDAPQSRPRKNNFDDEGTGDEGA